MTPMFDHCRLLLAALAVAPFAGLSAQVPSEVVRMAGCYDISLGAWSPQIQDTIRYAVPSHIRLDTARAERGPGRKLSPNIRYPGGRSFPGAPNWEIRGDSLVLIWSNGFTPTIVTLYSGDSVLTGSAIAESDAHIVGGPPRPRAAVVARRRACDPH